MKQVCREIQSHTFDDGWSENHEGPNCTLEMFRNWGRNGSDPLAWLSQLLKEFDIDSKERSAIVFAISSHVAFGNLLKLLRVEFMGTPA